MKLALFKGTRPGVAGLFSIACRWWLGGPYTHAELIFSDGMCGTSRSVEGGVVLRPLEFDPKDWDFFDVIGDEAAARHWFEVHKGEGFDYLGLLAFVWRRDIHRPLMWFCGEAISASLGVREPWRFDTCHLPILLGQRGFHAPET